MDLWGNEDAEEYRARIRAEFLGEAYHFPTMKRLKKPFTVAADVRSAAKEEEDPCCLRDLQTHRS